MTSSQAWLAPLGAAALLMSASSASAALGTYFQNFEGLDQMSPTALTEDGWLVGANVFDPTGTVFLYNYFPFPAPNGGSAFSGIDVGQGGPDQGDQQLVVYNDYNNADHANGTGNRIEANVFQEQTIGAGDIGSTWIFGSDVKAGNIEGDSTALAFIKTVDPNNNFSLTNFVIFDTTNVGDLWMSFQLSLFIDASLQGQLLQFGFLNVASNFGPSGMFYDNVSFTQVPVPAAVWLMLSGIAGLLGLRRRS